MKIQSFNVSVPAPCMNRCKFCVSSTRKNEINNIPIEGNKNLENGLFTKSSIYSYIHSGSIDWNKEISYYRDKFSYGSDRCDTLLITSTGEPLMNKKFLEFIGAINYYSERPFQNIEIQTSGLLLDSEYLDFLMEKVEVKTISLSLSALDNENNYRYNNPVDEKFKLNIDETCKLIKDNNLNLRLSLTLTEYYNRFYTEDSISNLFKRIQELGADQVTFKTLYESGGDLPEDMWVRKHKAREEVETYITDYIRKNGKVIRTLLTGEFVFSIHGMSVVINKDCMSRRFLEDTLRYVILKPDGKLYTQWDDPASLLF